MITSVVQRNILLCPIQYYISCLHLAQGSQYIPAAGVGDRDDATLQGPLFWSSPDERGDWLLPQPSLYMDTGESRKEKCTNMRKKTVISEGRRSCGQRFDPLKYSFPLNQ